MEVYETFHDAHGLRIGVLLRKVEATSLSTFVSFGNPDGTTYTVESRIELDTADPKRWTHLFHRVGHSFTERSRDGRTPADAVPGYAEYLVVRRLAESGHRDAFCQLLDEVTGELRPAEFTRRSNQIDVRVAGELTNRYWTFGDLVTATDWHGAWTHACQSREELADGLDPDIRAAGEAFLRK